MKPSDFPRDQVFLTPGPALLADGVAHLRSYRDARRAMLDRTDSEFTQDASFWAPQGERIHLDWYFMWATGVRRADGSAGRHAALRGLAEPWFRSRAVRTMAPQIQQITDELICEIRAGGSRFDLATGFANRLSIRTICVLLGFPLDREVWLGQQLDEYIQRDDVAKIHREPEVVEEYLWQVVDDRAAEKRDEFLDVLIAGWRGGQLSDLELLGYLWGTVSAGANTAGTGVVNAVALLDEFGYLEQGERLLSDPVWIERAVEETLRFATVFPAGPLLSVADVVTDDGVEIPAMTQVRLWYSAANRDAAVNGRAAGPDPNEFVPTRWPNRHVAFGAGSHHCLGAELTRLTITTALRTLISRLPNLRADGEFVRYAGIVDGVSSAPFRWGA